MDNSKELLRLLVNRAQAFSNLYERFNLEEKQWICNDIKNTLDDIAKNAVTERHIKEEILRAQRVPPLKEIK
jgi:hypothetical protein